MSTKTIVVTGASAGFGAALVHLYAADGWNIVAAARRTDRLDELAATYPKQVLPLTVDVSDADAVRAAFGSLPADFASIDVVEEDVTTIDPSIHHVMDSAGDVMARASRHAPQSEPGV